MPPEIREPKLTRAQKKERTRQQLVDAARELARTEGVAAVTTTRITQAVGVTQPAFYVHFKNVDECMAVASEQVAAGILELLRDVRRAVRENPNASISDALRATLELLLREPRMLETFLQYRRDTSSTLGRVMAATFETARQQLAEDIETAIQTFGLDARQLPAPQVLADLLAAVALGAAESVLDGRATLDELVPSLAGIVQVVIGAVALPS